METDTGQHRGTNVPRSPAKQPWPKEQAERTRVIQAALSAGTAPATAAELAKKFLRARGESVEEILNALTSLGLVRRLRGGKYAAR